MFFDSFNARGFQFYSGSPSSSTAKNLDFRIDEYTLSAAEHSVSNHRKNTRDDKILSGHNNDTKHILGTFHLPPEYYICWEGYPKME